MFELVRNSQNAFLSEIESASLPEFLLGDFPIVVAGFLEATLNIIYGDSGVGKSLLAQSLMRSVLESSEDFIVVWFDLEYQAGIAKQRKVDSLIRDFPGRFFLVVYSEEYVKAFRERYRREYTHARFLWAICNDIRKEFPEKRLLVFVDSLEDLISDTSDDREIKTIFHSLLSLKGVTFVFSHHIAKGELSSGLRFRGSMVIKAKLSSLVHIQKKEDINDFEAEFSVNIHKMRALWDGGSMVLVCIDKENLKVKSIVKNTDSYERKVLREAYFILKRENEMKKTDLVKAISSKLKTHHEKVRDVLDKYQKYFAVRKGKHNTHYLMLNYHVIGEYMAHIGLDNELSEVKQELVNELYTMRESGKEISPIKFIREDGSLVEYRSIEGLLKNIYRMSDNEAHEILKSLKGSGGYESEDAKDASEDIEVEELLEELDF